MLKKCEKSEKNAGLKFIISAICENFGKIKEIVTSAWTMRKMGTFQQSITYNTVSPVIGPQMKKLADIQVDAGTSHSNTKKKKAIQFTSQFLQINLYTTKILWNLFKMSLPKVISVSTQNSILKLVSISSFLNINRIFLKIWPKYGRIIVLCSSKPSLCISMSTLLPWLLLTCSILIFIWFSIKSCG